MLFASAISYIIEWRLPVLTHLPSLRSVSWTSSPCSPKDCIASERGTLSSVACGDGMSSIRRRWLKTDGREPKQKGHALHALCFVFGGQNDNQSFSLSYPLPKEIRCFFDTFEITYHKNSKYYSRYDKANKFSSNRN